jgi:pimeloyl-ACP methyl ester carboxylesterase
MLHALLEKGGEQPPYLMVGHSLGGVYVRAFTAQYPDEVVGLVLVDSSHEKQVQQAPPELEKFGNLQMASMRFLQITEPIGLLRAFRMLEPTIASLQLAEDEKAPVLAEMYRTGYLDATMREMEMFAAYSSQFEKLNSLRDLPLIVFSQKMDAQKLFDQYPPNIQAQLTMELMQQVADSYNAQQAELAALSTRGKQIIVEGSGHFIQVEKPQIVIDAIREVLEQVVR